MCVLLTYNGVLYFADENALDRIANLFLQLHVNKCALNRAGFISCDCVVVYIIKFNNLCLFERNE